LKHDGFIGDNDITAGVAAPGRGAAGLGLHRLEAFVNHRRFGRNNRRTDQTLTTRAGKDKPTPFHGVALLSFLDYAASGRASPAHALAMILLYSPQYPGNCFSTMMPRSIRIWGKTVLEYDLWPAWLKPPFPE
jgi:hypothetical protein